MTVPRVARVARVEQIKEISTALNCIPLSCPAAIRILRSELSRLQKGGAPR